jgi:hypothetical protein
MEQGEKLSRVLLHSIEILNFDISLGRAAFGEILMRIWEELLYGGVSMLILGMLQARHGSATWNLDTNTAFALRPRKAAGNLARGRSRSSSEYYLIIQTVPQRKHHTLPIQRSTG